MSPYDITPEITDGPRSPAFARFLYHWFVDVMALTRGEVDLTFLQDFTPEELIVARRLIRQNLHLRHTHIIDGAAILGDMEAVPLLRAMLADEPDLSRRLTISGALWKLVRDPAFPGCLQQAKDDPSEYLMAAHLHHVLWLGDERAVDFLIDLLDHKNQSVRSQVFSELNRLDLLGTLPTLSPEQPWPPGDYRGRREDPAFRKRMAAAVRQSLRESTNEK
jgi:hypothetical protein